MKAVKVHRVEFQRAIVKLLDHKTVGMMPNIAHVYGVTESGEAFEIETIEIYVGPPLSASAPQPKPETKKPTPSFLRLATVNGKEVTA